LIEVRDELDLSASDNLMSPVILFAIQLLQLRSSEVSDVFDVSTSDNLITPSLVIVFPTEGENEMKQQSFYRRNLVKLEMNLI
jgi:hypothetical protein